MTLDFATLGVFMTVFTVLLAVFMLVVWRINRHESGPAFWAAAAVVGIVVFGMIPLRPVIGSSAIVINNIGALLGPLLLLEGVLRYRRIGAFRRRLPWAMAALVLIAISAVINRENAPARFLLHDPVIMGVLATTAWFLVRDTRGLERTLHFLIAAFFAGFVLLLAYRWLAALQGTFAPEQHDNPVSGMVFLASVLWAFGWSFGLTISANLRASLRLAKMANQDPLTELPNRRFLHQQLHRHIGAKRSPDTGLAVVMMDINSFKALNDRFGHQFGDQVLQSFARLLIRQVRPDDMAVRYGGDEFVILLYGLNDRAQLEPALNRLRQSLEQQLQVGAHGIDIRISMGAALFPHDARNTDELLDIADRRMYEDKGLASRATRVFPARERRAEGDATAS